jgi:hypothetical protein
MLPSSIMVFRESIASSKMPSKSSIKSGSAPQVLREVTSEIELINFHSLQQLH